MKSYLGNHSKDFREALEFEEIAQRMDEAGVAEVDREETGGPVQMDDYRPLATNQKKAKAKAKAIKVSVSAFVH